MLTIFFAVKMSSLSKKRNEKCNLFDICECMNEDLLNLNYY